MKVDAKVLDNLVRNNISNDESFMFHLNNRIDELQKSQSLSYEDLEELVKLINKEIKHNKISSKKMLDKWMFDYVEDGNWEYGVNGVSSDTGFVAVHEKPNPMFYLSRMVVLNDKQIERILFDEQQFSLFLKHLSSNIIFELYLEIDITDKALYLLGNYVEENQYLHKIRIRKSIHNSDEAFDLFMKKAKLHFYESSFLLERNFHVSE